MKNRLLVNTSKSLGFVIILLFAAACVAQETTGDPDVPDAEWEAEENLRDRRESEEGRVAPSVPETSGSPYVPEAPVSNTRPGGGSNTPKPPSSRRDLLSNTKANTKIENQAERKFSQEIPQDINIDPATSGDPDVPEAEIYDSAGDTPTDTDEFPNSVPFGDPDIPAADDEELELMPIGDPDIPPAPEDPVTGQEAEN